MKRRSVHLTLGAFTIVAALAGCKRGNAEGKQAIEKQRPQVEARFAIARKIGTDLQTMPELTKDGVSLPYGPVVLRSISDATASDTAVLEEDRTLLSLSAPPSLTLIRAGQLQHCERTLSGKYDANITKENADRTLGTCANAKYLIVVRTVKRTDGKVNPGTSTFTPGQVKAELRVFDFGSGKDLGGYRLSAKNTNFVSSKSQPDDYTVRSDLDRELQAAVNEALDKLVAGGK